MSGKYEIVTEHLAVDLRGEDLLPGRFHRFANGLIRYDLNSSK
jgi:hypothetical protein